MPLPLKLIVWVLGLVITLRLVRSATTPFVAVAWLLYLLLPDVFHHADPRPRSRSIWGQAMIFFLHNPSPRLMMKYLAEGLVNLWE
jgi:hypothetical protein